MHWYPEFIQTIPLLTGRKVTMSQELLVSAMLQAIEEELKQRLYHIEKNIPASFLDMLTYHLGWTGEGSGPNAAGKRIRPLLLLLITSACGHEWRTSLPAAASIELVHNFSLIHDDIQDGSPTRRGRPAVWKKYGAPLAINAGDALFSLANLSLMDLSSFHGKNEIILSTQIIHSACLHLTIGQHLDMTSMDNTEFSIEDYWVMIEEKTASLFSSCAELGALLGGANKKTIHFYRDFGKLIGIAFQIQDDYLGLWGTESIVGKPTTSDIENKKKSFPIIYGLQKGGEFSRQWKKYDQNKLDAAYMISLLEADGIKAITRNTIKKITTQAVETLLKAEPKDPSRNELFSIVKDLEGRVK